MAIGHVIAVEIPSVIKSDRERPALEWLAAILSRYRGGPPAALSRYN